MRPSTSPVCSRMLTYASTQILTHTNTDTYTYMMTSVSTMSVPAVGKEAAYRNPIDDVARFFATYHLNQFLIFNLCSVLTLLALLVQK